MEQRIARLKQAFKAKYGSLDRASLYRAPGRVNIIGEHTDYNGGFVLPMAISHHILLMAQPRDDNTLRMNDLNFPQEITVQLDHLVYDPRDDWGNYPKGVAHILISAGHALRGLNLFYEGNIPVASGLSSSAAIEVVTCLALVRQFGLKVPDHDIPFLAQRAENEFVGMRCGIMDQFIITLARAGQAIFLDCRSHDFEYVPVPAQKFRFIIGNTKVERKLTGGEYNQRRAECEQGVALLQKTLPDIKQLRDISVAQFKELRDQLPAPIQQRCEHVIYENERVRQSITALKANRFGELGQLMNQSHESLAQLYEVSCNELNTMVQSARKIKGVLGSRMTGAGFGGCTVSLVEAGSVDEFIQQVGREYEQETRIKSVNRLSRPEFYVAQPSDGAGQIDIS